MDNQSTTFLEFAWNSLTDQQKFRIEVKYELSKRLKENNECKRTTYRAIALEYGYTMARIEKIARVELKRNK